jgi:glycosyltransferase involved in cell wall biosynthesis
MSGITGILHTQNDGLRVARAVESLRACDEVLVVDHGSSDGTCEVARRFGARVVEEVGEANNDWFFCLRPSEVVLEPLEAELLEWTGRDVFVDGLLVSIMEETREGWRGVPAEVRLVRWAKVRWDGWRPVVDGTVGRLEGHLARLRLP